MSIAVTVYRPTYKETNDFIKLVGKKKYHKLTLNDGQFNITRDTVLFNQYVWFIIWFQINCKSKMVIKVAAQQK